MRSGAVAAAPLQEHLGHFVDARAFRARRRLDVDAYTRQARHFAAIDADEMWMLAVPAAQAFELKPPNMISQLDARDQTGVGKFDQVAIDRGAVESLGR